MCKLETVYRHVNCIAFIRRLRLQLVVLPPGGKKIWAAANSFWGSADGGICHVRLPLQPAGYHDIAHAAGVFLHCVQLEAAVSPLCQRDGGLRDNGSSEVEIPLGVAPAVSQQLIFP